MTGRRFLEPIVDGFAQTLIRDWLRHILFLSKENIYDFVALREDLATSINYIGLSFSPPTGRCYTAAS